MLSAENINLALKKALKVTLKFFWRCALNRNIDKNLANKNFEIVVASNYDNQISILQKEKLILLKIKKIKIPKEYKSTIFGICR